MPSGARHHQESSLSSSSDHHHVVVAAAAFNSLLNYLLLFLILLSQNSQRMFVGGAGVDYCYSDIGCFPLSAEFYHPRHRPFNVRPLHRRHIRTQFELFNRAHPEGYMLLPWDKFNLAQSRFDPRLETKIIVPGWLDNINRAVWVRRLKDALLWLWAPANIIVVRWTNFTPYTVATANTRVVGAELANLMKFLERQLNYDPAFYHIIGHSLGAHIAGYAGDRVPGLGRITALDPARPFFQHMPKSVRLDRGDAKFVDAIHSDFTPENAIFLIMSYGMTTPVGHLDFYPNGPPLFQPGCTRDTLLSVQNGIAKGLQENSLSVAFLESTRYLTACDHQRSHEWFIESITNRECAFVGVRCNEFEGMINGRCTCDDSPSACAIMGIHADQMYLNNVHEELWPVRAGSIDYRYKPKRRRPTTNDFNDQYKLQHYHPASSQAAYYAMMMQAANSQAPQSPLAGVPVDMDDLGNSAEYNYNLLAQSAALATATAAQQNGATKDELYARLKQQFEQAHEQAGVPSLAAAASDADAPTQVDAHTHQKKSLVYSDAVGPASQEQEEAAAAAEAQADANSNVATDTGSGGNLAADDEQAEASEQVEPSRMALDNADAFLAMTQQHMQEVAALNDLAFAQYLRSFLFTNRDSSGSARDQQNQASNTTATRQTGETFDDDDDSPASKSSGETPESSSTNKTSPAAESTTTEAQNKTIERRNGGIGGQHPLLLSSSKRDIESWYEDNVRWHLKTNNRPQYCSNQYQLLIYLGELKTASGRDRLRANLVVSIIGTRGQLLNQRFIPRGSTLTSFTMQPFFILLEGSYSLGQIKSVALAWEARSDPDPIKATVTFQSSLVQHIGQHVPAYKAKQFPWLPEETKYDYSQGFSRALSGPKRIRVSNQFYNRRQHHFSPEAHPLEPHRQLQLRVHHKIRTAASERRPRLHHPLRTVASELIKANIAGHYSQQYAALGAGLRMPHPRPEQVILKRSGLSATVQSIKPQQCNLRAPGKQRQPEALGCHVDSTSRKVQGQKSPLPAPPPGTSSAQSTFSKRSDLADNDEQQDLETNETDQGEEELLRQLRERQLVAQILRLKQTELQQEASRLLSLQQLQQQLQQQQQQQQQLQQQVNAAGSLYAPNQTYVMPPTRLAEVPTNAESGQHQQEQQADEFEQVPDLSLTNSETYFVPVVDPPEEPSMYVPKPGSGVPSPLESSLDQDGKVTLDLHNIDHSILKNNVALEEDSIVINQIVVSPLQATYGRYGRSAKTFCPPASAREQLLVRDQTIQLMPTFMTRCHQHYHQHRYHHLDYQAAPMVPEYA